MLLVEQGTQFLPAARSEMHHAAIPVLRHPTDRKKSLQDCGAKRAGKVIAAFGPVQAAAGEAAPLAS